MICYVLAMGKQHLEPHVVVGYGIKIFVPRPLHCVTRSPGLQLVIHLLMTLLRSWRFIKKKRSLSSNDAQSKLRAQWVVRKPVNADSGLKVY